MRAVPEIAAAATYANKASDGHLLHAHARRYVAYYRVSTGQQLESGLGLESQRAQVLEYVAANKGSLVGEYSETASGRRNDRPQLTLALTTCRIMGATLVIARLDRLSRNVALIARLLESGLDFVAVDFPYANKFTIHILAAVAEYESRIQSERMNLVFAALKQRGTKVGNTRRDSTRRFPPGCQEASAQVRRTRAETRRCDLAPLLWKLMAEGKSCRVIAAEFNETGVAPLGKGKWTLQSVWRIARLLAVESPCKPEVFAATRIGAAQLRVSRLVDQIGPLLVELRRRVALIQTSQGSSGSAGSHRLGAASGVKPRSLATSTAHCPRAVLSLPGSPGEPAFDCRLLSCVDQAATAFGSRVAGAAGFSAPLHRGKSGARSRRHHRDRKREVKGSASTQRGFETMSGLQGETRHCPPRQARTKRCVDLWPSRKRCGLCRGGHASRKPVHDSHPCRGRRV